MINKKFVAVIFVIAVLAGIVIGLKKQRNIELDATYYEDTGKYEVYEIITDGFGKVVESNYYWTTEEPEL